MAEEESTTNISPPSESSKESQDHHDDQAWLRLGIGTHASSCHPHLRTSTREQQIFDPTLTARAQQRSLVAPGFTVELNLQYPGGSTSSGGAFQQPRPALPLTSANTIHAPPRPDSIMTSGGVSSFGESLLFQHQGPGGLNFAVSTSTTPIIQGHGHRRQINWGFPPPIINPRMLIAASSSSPSSSLMPLGPFFTDRPFHQAHIGVHGTGPSSYMRVIEPPRRPHSGIWFMLLASQNQAKEPFLPQVAKSYIRIKDGRMTVRLLMKYLANKLELDSESEIEAVRHSFSIANNYVPSGLREVKEGIKNSLSSRHPVPCTKS